MKKSLIYLLVAILVLAMPMMGCTAKYKEAIAQMEVEIEDLEQDVDDLEDKNEDLNNTVEELEARPTCTPVPDPTPTPIPLGENLGFKMGDLLIAMVRNFILYDASDRPSGFNDLAQLQTYDFQTTGIKDNENGLYTYLYDYENIGFMFEVDDDDYVYSIFILGADVYTDTREVNTEKMHLASGAFLVTLKGMYGDSNGSNIFTELTNSEDKYVVREGNYHSFSIYANENKISFFIKPN